MHDNEDMVCVYVWFESDSNLFLMILRIKITHLLLLNLVTNCKDFATLVHLHQDAIYIKSYVPGAKAANHLHGTGDGEGFLWAQISGRNNSGTVHQG